MFGLWRGKRRGRAGRTFTFSTDLIQIELPTPWSAARGRRKGLLPRYPLGRGRSRLPSFDWSLPRYDGRPLSGDVRNPLEQDRANEGD